MNGNVNEQLSALMDGELSEQELSQLLEQMEQEPDVRRQWSDYHAIRHRLFEKHPYSPNRDCSVADRVAEAVAAEPVVLAPRSGRSAKVRRPWVPLALAASLAGATFLVIQPTLQQEIEPLAQNRVETEWVEIDGRWVERWINPTQQSDRMQSYLVRHDENRLHARERAALVSTAPSAIVKNTVPIEKRIVGWRIGWLPHGFRKVDTLQHQIPTFGGAVTQLVLSNGEAVFSVFIEKNGTEGITERRMKGDNRPVNLYSHQKLGHRITVLGEIPPDVVRKVAQSIEAESG